MAILLMTACAIVLTTLRENGLIYQWVSPVLAVAKRQTVAILLSVYLGRHHYGRKSRSLHMHRCYSSVFG